MFKEKSLFVPAKCHKVRLKLFREVSREKSGEQRTKFAHFAYITFSQYCSMQSLPIHQVNLMANLDRSCPDQSKSCFVFKTNVELLMDRQFCKHFLDISFHDTTIAVFKFVIYLSYS